MMIVDGERVWVPDCRKELIAGLKRMGIHKVAGIPLDRLSRQELTSAYCRERSRIVRRQHQGHSTLRPLSFELPAIEEERQLELFPAG